ncbi:MAG: hypothetical protein Q8L48_25455 [Archangium sp.]|nr:hypothetical protein [Archangium sp.]
MTKLLAALHLNDPASLKRALTAALSAMALLAINPLLIKWHMPPISDAVIASVAGIIAIFVLQSGLKSGAIAVASLTASTPPQAPDVAAAAPVAAVSTAPDAPITVPAS